MEPTFFAAPEDFRAWLEAHHETETELLVGFYNNPPAHAAVAATSVRRRASVSPAPATAAAPAHSTALS